MSDPHDESTPAMSPRYPDLEVSLRTEHPLALVSATRLALRRAGMDPSEIESFTRTALSSADPRRACSRYVRLDDRRRD